MIERTYLTQAGAVRRLLAEFDLARDQLALRVVLISAPPGWGKTYVIHQFYKRLAAERQRQPAYWPDAIISTSGLSARKVTYPAEFEIPAGARPSWLWWGAACVLTDGHRSLNVLKDNERQVHIHIEAVLEKIERRIRNRQRAIDIASSLLSLMPLPDVVGVTLTAKDVSKTLWSAAHEKAEQRRADQSRSGGTVAVNEIDMASVHEWAQALKSVLGRDLPLVLFLEDAHAADPSTLALILLLGHINVPALVIAASWPSEIDPGLDIDNSRSVEQEGFLGFVSDLNTRPLPEASIIELTQIPRADLIQIVRSTAPSTRMGLVERLIERSGRNPYVLSLILNLQSIRMSIVDGAIDIDDIDFQRLPTSVTSLWDQIWNDLDDDSRTLLVLSALQGEESLMPAVEHVMLELGFLPPGRSYSSPSGDSLVWLLQLDDFLQGFRERVHFDVAAANAEFTLGRRLRDARAALLRYAEAILLTEDDLLSIRARLVLMRAYLSWSEQASKVNPVAARKSSQAIAEQAMAGGQLLSALKYARAAIGWSGDDVAESLIILASRLHLRLDQSIEAEHLLQSPAGVAARRSGNGWPAVLLAECFMKQGRNHEAAEMLSYVIDPIADPNNINPAELEALRLKGNLMFTLGDLGSSRSLIEGAIQFNRSLASPDPYLDVTLLRNLVPLENAAGNYLTALELRERVLNARLELLGEFHPDTIDARESYARSHLILGNDEIGREALVEVVGQRREVFGSGSPATLYSRRALAALDLINGSKHSAGVLAEIAQELSGDLYPRQRLFLDAWALLGSRYNADAQGAYRRLFLRENLLGEDNPNVFRERIALIDGLT